MRKSADVKSIDALRSAKAAFAEFREQAGGALSEANSDVLRTLWWVQNDRRTYWQQQVRRRTEKLNGAKSDLYRAQLAAMDDRASCIDQRKAIERAERALAEARQKVEAVRKWALMLDREFMLFKGRCQAISRSVDSDMPRAEAKLELLLDRLDRYVRLQAPEQGPPRRSSAAPPTTANERTSKPSTETGE